MTRHPTDQPPTPADGQDPEVPEQKQLVCPMLSIGQMIAAQMTFLHTVKEVRKDQREQSKVAIATADGTPAQPQEPVQFVRPEPFLICLGAACAAYVPDLAMCGLRADTAAVRAIDYEHGMAVEAEGDGGETP